ncbi:GlxA family transcriptional regulator [Arthrobacter mobilis]|uniref:Helix-turn-helix domain-containing protein n=1 Tax=Arthrobacter mobilis TaxID=2724944 RepID=A0A7X6HF65_9MICC|nr:helix-turn-helix domain-containing protein [Arthrobacter mobilis]NKX54542.1 helix-turn-helix domain-containing protein [Arthrobacter mobilis]
MLKKVAVLVLPEASPFEFGVVCEVFGIDRSDRGTGVPAFDFTVCTERPGTIGTKTGFSINVPRGLDAAEDTDLVVVAPYQDSGPLPQAVKQALRRAHARGAWVLSVCSGAFALAEAGLLDGRRATTHWRYSRRLAEEYPLVEVDENVLYVQDGRIITSAGTAAGIDACLHLVRTELGASVAAAIARDMVVPPHRDGGQAQYIDRPVSLAGCNTLKDLLVWLGENLGQDVSVAELAARVHMSERTFARRFRAETGATPAAWLNSQRVLRAQELLEESDLAVEEIARVCGFGQAVLLRHHFTKVLGISPAAYRRTFRGVRPMNLPQHTGT